MDSTRLAPDASSNASLAAPSRVLLTTGTDYRAALDSLIQAARTSIKIFDADGVQYELNSTRRLESLSTFLRSGSEAKLTMVLRSLEHVEKKCPRFVQLVALHSNQVTIRQTDHEASRLEDCLLITDDAHFARRNVQAHGRGVVVRNDEREATPMIERFQQIIGASTVVSLATTLGL